MVYPNLINQKVTAMNLSINFEPVEEKSLELSFGSSFSIKYADDYKHCLAILQQKVYAKDDPKLFSIDIDIQGAFECEEITDEKKQEIHVQCYYLLFPYVQMHIAQMCLAAGLPPLMIPPIKITSEDVKIKDTSNE